MAHSERLKVSDVYRPDGVGVEQVRVLNDEKALGVEFFPPDHLAVSNVVQPLKKSLLRANSLELLQGSSFPVLVDVRGGVLHSQRVNQVIFGLSELFFTNHTQRLV